jgi:hypothetical protein
VSGPQFFQTRMGQRFFEVTMPKIADELAHLNPSLRAIAAALQASKAQPPVADVAPRPPDAQAQPSASEVHQADADVMATLGHIARVHLGILTLKVRNRDSLDFHEVSVLSVTAALRAAYEAGVACGPSTTTH